LTVTPTSQGDKILSSELTGYQSAAPIPENSEPTSSLLNRPTEMASDLPSRKPL